MTRCLVGAIAAIIGLISIAQHATAWDLPCEAVCFSQSCTFGFQSAGCPRCQCAPDPCTNQPCRTGVSCRSMPRNCSFTKECEHVAVCGGGSCGQGCPETCPFGYEFLPGHCPACVCAPNPCDVDPCLAGQVCTSTPTTCEHSLGCKHVPLCNGLASCKQTCFGKTCQWGFSNSACPRCNCAENPCVANPCPSGQQCTPVTGSCIFNHECPYSRRCETTSCPIDLMVVVDTSSSVSRNKMTQLKSGLNSMAGFLDLNLVMAGICYFGTTQLTVSTLTSSLSQLQTSVTDSFPLRGRTIASLGLGCANTQLLNSRPNVPDAILLVIDGNVSDPPNTPQEEQATLSLLALLKARGVVVIVSAIGEAFTDLDAIREYASFDSNNNRRFTHTATFEEFNNLFSTRGIDIPCPAPCDVKSICSTRSCRFGFGIGIPGECPRCTCAPDPCLPSPCRSDQTCRAISHGDCNAEQCPHKPFCEACDQNPVCTTRQCSFGFRVNVPGECLRCTCAPNPCDSNPCASDEICTTQTTAECGLQSCPHLARCSPCDKTRVCTTRQCNHGFRVNVPGECVRCTCAPNPCDANPCASNEICTSQQTSNCGYGNCPHIHQCSPCDKTRVCTTRQCTHGFRVNVPGECVRCTCAPNPCDANPCASSEICISQSTSSCGYGNCPHIHQCSPCDKTRVCTTSQCTHGFRVNVPGECVRCTCAPNPCDANPCASDEICTSQSTISCGYGNCPHIHQCSPCDKTSVCTTRQCTHGFRVNVPGECVRCTCAPNPCDANPCASGEICTSQPTTSCGYENCPNRHQCSPCDKTRVCTTRQCTHGFRVNVPGECVRCTCAPNPCDANPCASDEICTSQPTTSCGYENCPNRHQCSPCNKTRVCTTRQCNHGFLVNVPGECVRCTCAPNPCDTNPCASDVTCTSQSTISCGYGNCPHIHQCSPCDKTRVCTTRQCTHGFRVNVPGECVRCTCAPNPCDANPCASGEICTSQPTTSCGYENCPNRHQCSPCDKTSVCTTRQCTHGFRVNVPGECVRCTCAPNPCDTNPCASNEICTSEATSSCGYGNCPHIHQCSPCEKSTVCSSKVCPYGFLVNVPGECQRCTCAPDPCLANPCRSDQICTSRSSNLCGYSHCPHEHVCTACEKDEVCPRPSDPCVYGYEIHVPGECTRCTCAPNPCRPDSCDINENCIPMPVPSEVCGVVECPYQAFCIPIPCDKHEVCNNMTCHFGFNINECPRCTCSPDPCSVGPADVCPPNHNCSSEPINCEYGHCPHTLICVPIPPPQCDICQWARTNCNFGVILGCHRCACAPDPCLDNGPCSSGAVCVRAQNTTCGMDLCPHISYCEPMPTTPTPAPFVDACDQPKDPGSCDPADDHLPRFFYDKVMGRCFAFEYSGCNGNENRFMLWWDCYERCMNDFDSSDSSGFPHHSQIDSGSDRSNSDSSDGAGSSDSSNGGSDNSDGAGSSDSSADGSDSSGGDGSSDSSGGDGSSDSSDGDGSSDSSDGGSDSSDGTPAEPGAGSSDSSADGSDSSNGDGSSDSSDGDGSSDSSDGDGSSDSSDGDGSSDSSNGDGSSDSSGSGSDSSDGAPAEHGAGSSDSSDDSSDSSDGAPAGHAYGAGSSDSSADGSDSSDGVPAEHPAVHGQAHGGSDSGENNMHKGTYGIKEAPSQKGSNTHPGGWDRANVMDRDRSSD